MSMWKKVGAVVGSAVMIGATLAGAAFAQTMDLGDYDDLMIGPTGSVQGMFVVGANAATADVVSAINMGAWVGNNAMASGGAGTGDVTLTPIESEVQGMTRHVEIDNWANVSKEFGASVAGSDVIGPEDYASGDNVVNYLYSHNEKGPIYVGGDEYQWHEEISVNLTKINAPRDILSAEEGDQYDEVFLAVNSQSMTYRFIMDKAICPESLQGEKIWFMGKEYTIISGDNDEVKLGASDAEVLLTTANPSTTLQGIDVTLEGVYSQGTGQLYKAKITITNGGRTETKFVNGGAIESIAGIEVFVKDAVVTTSGTNEGEAQIIVGAGILKLTDGDYLERGDGTETTWQVNMVDDNSGGCALPTFFDKMMSLEATETQTYNALTGDYPVLSPGDEIPAPNGLFALRYNGLTDQYGEDYTTRTVNIQPTTRDLNRTGVQQKVIRIRTPDLNAIEFTDAGVRKVDNEIWCNVSEGDDVFYFKDDSQSPSVYTRAMNPLIKLTTSKQLLLNWTDDGGAIGDGYLYLTEPQLEQALANDGFAIEYNVTTGKFDDIDGDTLYAGVDSGGANFPMSEINSTQWTGRNAGTTRTRDLYTRFGTYVSSTGQYQVTLEAPLGQAWAEFMVGVSSTGTGTPITASAGETVSIGGTTLEVSGGGISGATPAALPTSIALLDTQVTSAHKAGYTLALVGGPKVNTLVNQLQTEGKLAKTITNVGEGGDISTAGQGVVELVEDAWGTGKYAVVIAGSDRAGTNAASQVLAHFEDNLGVLDGQQYYIV